jgi:hypothetical protein
MHVIRRKCKVLLACRLTTYGMKELLDANNEHSGTTPTDKPIAMKAIYTKIMLRLKAQICRTSRQTSTHQVRRRE